MDSGPMSGSLSEGGVRRGRVRPSLPGASASRPAPTGAAAPRSFVSCTLYRRRRGARASQYRLSKMPRYSCKDRPQITSAVL